MIQQETLKKIYITSAVLLAYIVFLLMGPLKFTGLMLTISVSFFVLSIIVAIWAIDSA
jgi:hypothetical protein